MQLTRKAHLVLLTSTIMLMVSHGQAETTATVEGQDGYYEEKERGWFWKEPEPAEPEEEKEKAVEIVPMGQATPTEQTHSAEEIVPLHPEYEGPRPFSPAWLREKLPEYKDKALDNPTQDNVRMYYYVQRYAMDMAERFALTAQKVVLSDPILDENSRRPLSNVGAQVFDERAKAATEQLTQKIASQAGLWYFYRSDCPYCKAQNPILENMQRKYDMAILPIALDGRPMPDGSFANYHPNRGQAEQLGVQATPTIYMIKPPNDFVLVSEGLVAENSMKQRMILGAQEAGWITEQEFNLTRPVTPIQIQADLGELSEEVLNDPQKLVEILRNKITTSPYID